MSAKITAPAILPKVRAERTAWRSFTVAMIALAIAFVMAVYSGAAAETASLWTAAIAGLGSLALAGWTAVTIVPVLARRTPLRWLAYQVDYRVTREGVIYLVGVFAVALAALNTGNNLLFLVLGCLLAVILLSGIVSRITLTGIELKLTLPEHVFAAQPAPALLELNNLKRTLPSFSLRVIGESTKDKKNADAKLASAPLLQQPVYFPYLPRQQSVRQSVELTFPRRGVYRQKMLALKSRFPFGFLEKTRKVPAEAEIVVYPPITPTEEFYAILPLISGEIESHMRGRGNDLYAIRDLVPTDNARFVDWKATARAGTLKVREFAREDERRVLLVLDPFFYGTAISPEGARKFERAVELCACLAWHFYQLGSAIGLRTASAEVQLAPGADSIYDVLGRLALAEPREADSRRDFLREIADDSQEGSPVFKIVLTCQPRSLIPTSLWASSYLLFFDAL